MTFDVAFLGGASEVGASCIVVRFGDSWLVVDAGVRMSGAAEERLPDFSALDGAHVAAIVITHAHADHIGALPILHQRFPSAPIYTTSASIRLMTIMLADAIAVMEKRAAEELELPLYDSAAVEQMLRRLTPLAVDDRHAIPEIPGLVVSLRLAGHIAGAVSVGLEHPEGRVVISGDISIAPQRTIQGAQAPLVTQPDLLILESTYGGREHAPRRMEEQRLAAEVAAAIQRGGHVLIPAFALGRAQEVILILQEAQRRREIPHFTVWVDGLVRRVCAAYSTIPTFLSPAVRQRVVRGQPVFFTDTIHMVAPAQRKGILQGQPACIIASSGMLTGGPSRWYAERLLTCPEATVALTGYQDEEAPGRALQQVAAGQRDAVVLGEQRVTVAAKVMTYYLSGHADQAELVGFAQQIRPRLVALVHGDGGARNGLAAALRASGMSVALPPTGDVLHVPTTRRAVSQPVTQASPAHTRHAAPDTAEALALALWEEEGRPVEPVVVEAREVARRWYGAEGAPEEIQAVVAVLAADPHRFQPIAALAGFYRLLPPAALRQSAPVETPRVEAGSLILARINGTVVAPWFCQRVTGG
ncbi:MAG: MBL fold metallo-hydrolase, partial [Oscillochloris sp.]|nr:MBL fold metallo-hydrolase [Oscillochloris sp.]